MLRSLSSAEDDLSPQQLWRKQPVAMAISTSSIKFGKPQIPNDANRLVVTDSRENESHYARTSKDLTRLHLRLPCGCLFLPLGMYAPMIGIQNLRDGLVRLSLSSCFGLELSAN
jgi:hypothetical protein